MDPTKIRRAHLDASEIAKPELLLAGLVIKFSGLTIADAVAEGTDLTTSQTAFSPSLIAGEVPLPGGPRHRFAYSVLTRYQHQTQGLAKADLTGEEFELPTVALVTWVSSAWSAAPASGSSCAAISHRSQSAPPTPWPITRPPPSPGDFGPRSPAPWGSGTCRCRLTES